MTPDEATDRMKAISQFPTARGHMEADAILVQIAEEAGFRGAVNAYYEIGMWYE